MKKDKADLSRQRSAEGLAAGAGKSVEPLELPEEEAPAHSSPPRALPIGIPLSPEEYRRLKEEAGRRVAPPARTAQEDPAIPHDDRESV